MQRKPIPGYFGIYEADTIGRIWRVYGGANHQLLGTPLNGYVQVNLCAYGVRKAFYVHQLIAMTFLGEPPAGKTHINHKDRDKTNNRVDNLEYQTPSGNARHTHATGHRTRRGEDHACAVLSARMVRLIRRAVKQRIPATRIAALARVHVMTVYKVAARTRWAHVKD